jgi:hypothetical protein
MAGRWPGSRILGHCDVSDAIIIGKKNHLLHPENPSPEGKRLVHVSLVIRTCSTYQLLRAKAPPIKGPATPAMEIVMPIKVDMNGSKPGGAISGYTIIV